MVRMAKFSFRYQLVDGHGNFGSIDGDGAAAIRYTEARMSKIAMEMLRDIRKDTVDFHQTIQREMEPTVYAIKIPNLLVNGASGIAVNGNQYTPHNLGEVISAAYIENPELTVMELMEEHLYGRIFQREDIY